MRLQFTLQVTYTNCDQVTFAFLLTHLCQWLTSIGGGGACPAIKCLPMSCTQFNGGRPMKNTQGMHWILLFDNVQTESPCFAHKKASTQKRTLCSPNIFSFTSLTWLCIRSQSLSWGSETHFLSSCWKTRLLDDSEWLISRRKASVSVWQYRTKLSFNSCN